MRDKFSELIKQGVAEFKYTNISKDIPEQDLICRMYNNIFSIPSDTHMSCLEDGRRVITGHMINTDNWGKFLMSCCWGAVNFVTSGTWSVYDFLYRHNLEGRIGILNGDVVYFVTPIPMEKYKAQMSAQVVTNESNIPMPITTLTTTGDLMHIKECFDCDDVKETVRRMNESTRVKGNNWVPSDNGIVGLIGNKVYIIGEAKEYHRYSIDTRDFTDPRGNEFIKIQVFDCYFDKLYSALIDTSTGGVTGDFNYPKFMEKFLDSLNEKIKKFDWTKDLECPMAYTITMPNPHSKDGWKLNRYPGYEIFTGMTSIGQLKKRTR